MLPLNDYLYLKDYKLNRLPEVEANAEEYRLLEEGGLVRRSWLSCQICRSLWRLGHALGEHRPAAGTSLWTAPSEPHLVREYRCSAPRLRKGAEVASLPPLI